jgi:enoyl-CoA hydratase/carnithine racemase
MTDTIMTPQILLTRRSPTYWRVTFAHPPLNIFGPDMLPQLNAIITALETDEHVKVVVMDSAVEGFFLTHYNFASCKFFGDRTGQSMKTYARVGFPRVRQAHTQEVSRWHASASPWKTTMAARSMATRSASMTCLEGQSA